MINNRNKWKVLLLTVMLLTALCGLQISVQASSGDNSLSTLGILTEGVQVSPEFYYSTIEYNVMVPAGTTQLQLEPVTSHPNASIVDITGTELVNGETTVKILVEAENGNRYTYYLYVETDPNSVVQTEAPETEPQTEAPETEPETEDPRYVRVDRNSLQEAENTISALKAETGSYRDRLDILMKILYGLIGFCVILLFVVINLTLKKKDLKAELQKYMGMGYQQENGEMMQNQAPYQNGYENSGYAYGGQNAGYENPDAQYGYGDPNEQYGYEAPNAQYGYEEQQDLQEMNYDMPDPVPQMEDEAPKKVKKQKARAKAEDFDDPNDVPKPEKARKKAKPMPKYQKPSKQADYQPNENASENVEINMVDL